MKPIFGALRRSAATENDVREVTSQLQRQTERLANHRGRFVKQGERLEKQRADTETLRGELKRQAQLINDQKKTIAELKGEIQPLKRADKFRDVDWGRAMQQLGALETRVGGLEEKLETGNFTADGTSLQQARSLVDTVRREHDQVRVRFQVISAYEERMRRLEAAMIEMYDGDIRNPL